MSHAVPRSTLLESRCKLAVRLASGMGVGHGQVESVVESGRIRREVGPPDAALVRCAHQVGSQEAEPVVKSMSPRGADNEPGHPAVAGRTIRLPRKAMPGRSRPGHEPLGSAASRQVARGSNDCIDPRTRR